MSLSTPGAAQESDTVVTETRSKPFTVKEEISNAAERKAFVELYRKKNPRRQEELSEEFLLHYPASPVLAQVYEIAAKAQIQLGNYDKALKYANESLQIYPENPLLLVPLANVQAKLGLIDEAQQNARRALEYLQQFSRPQAISKHKWSRLYPQLMASCYFVLGRTELLQGLQQHGQQERAEALKQSLASLTRAQELNPDDPEIFYLAGLTCLAMDQKNAAAANFAAAAKSDDERIRTMATEKLTALFRASGLDHKTSFRDYLDELDSKARPTPVHLQSSEHRPETPLPGYSGSQACQLCHTEIYQEWSRTGMASMLRPYEPQNIIGDFKNNNVFYEGDKVALKRSGQIETIPGKQRKLFARMIMVNGRPFFKILQSDGRWHVYRVDYTIGSKWQQAYATRLPNGEIHVFPIEYNVLHKRWINFWKIIDAPGSERANPENWERLDISTNYMVECAACHTSQLRNTKGGGFTAQDLKFREPGIDCEMCHGPAAQHVALMKKGKLYSKLAIDPPVDFSKISSKQFMEICAQCHMQSAIRVPGPDGEINYSRSGPNFFELYKNRPYDEFSDKAFYKDGRFRATTFIVESLMRTECYRKGQVTCGNCHDPHLQNSGSNPNSLKLIYLHNPNLMCTQCHVQYKSKAEVERHTHHTFNTKGSLCVSCHMPRIMRGLQFWARTHRIDNIPNPQMTVRFGESASPDACLLCHTDENVHWVASKLAAWKAKQGSQGLQN